jgi:hypothetical protein
MTLVPSDALEISTRAARLSLTASVTALASLASLHVVSPEFDPSRRAVSEYALGQHGWLLSLMFLAWALGAWALAFAIRSQVSTSGGKIGLVFLVAAGIGWAMASVFDARWPKLHILSALIGIPILPLAAMLISANLRRTPAWFSAKRVVLGTANLTWMSLALMAAMVALTGETGSPETLIGLPNRLLIARYSGWMITVAWQAIRVRGNAPRVSSPAT